MKELQREICNPTVVAGGTVDQVDRKKRRKDIKDLTIKLNKDFFSSTHETFTKLGNLLSTK